MPLIGLPWDDIVSFYGHGGFLWPLWPVIAMAIVGGHSHLLGPADLACSSARRARAEASC